MISFLQKNAFQMPFIILPWIFFQMLCPKVVLAENITSSNVRKIVYPITKDSTQYQVQSNYYLDVLKLALARTDVSYELEIIKIPAMPQSRSSVYIQQGLYDIHWLSTSEQRENSLNPIRIPLLKGLLGLRIALVNSKNPNFLSDVANIDGLKKLYAGQGHDWLDTKLLRHHGFRVHTSSNTKSLFDLLIKGRVDYFPRSILEVWFEQEFFNNESLSIDEHIAIYYPLVTYFFLRNDAVEMHDQIQLGLQRAIKDGSFQNNFDTYFEQYIEKANLDKRKVYILQNPFIPSKTPINDPELWFQLPLE